MLSPFSPLDSGGRRSSGGGGMLDGLRTIAVLRVGAGLVLFLAYALEATLRAWHYIWSHREWDMISKLGAVGVPLPHILAPTAAFISITVAVAWMIGFYTRLFAVVFMPVVIGGLIAASWLGAGESATVIGWLFLFITATLMLFGSGQISVDGLFRLGSRSSKRLF